MVTSHSERLTSHSGMLSSHSELLTSHFEVLTSHSEVLISHFRRLRWHFELLRWCFCSLRSFVLNSLSHFWPLPSVSFINSPTAITQAGRLFMLSTLTRKSGVLAQRLESGL